MDSHVSSTAASTDVGGGSGVRMVSDVGVTRLPEATARLQWTGGASKTGGLAASVGGGSGGGFCPGNTSVLVTAVVAPEGSNDTGVTSLTLKQTAADGTKDTLEALSVRTSVAKGVSAKPHAPGTSAIVLCNLQDKGGIALVGRGSVHDNPGGRFKHKSIHYPPSAASKAGGGGDAAPLVFVAARAKHDSADAGTAEAAHAVFATSVRSSSDSKFEVNIVRLDQGGHGWQHELQVDYLRLPFPGDGAKKTAGAELQLTDGKGSAQYGALQVGASKGPKSVRVAFQNFQLKGGKQIDVVLTAQATGEHHKDEVFTVTLGPNATTVEGFSAT